MRSNLAFEVRHSKTSSRWWEQDLGPLFPPDRTNLASDLAQLRGAAAAPPSSCDNPWAYASAAATCGGKALEVDENESEDEGEEEDVQEAEMEAEEEEDEEDEDEEVVVVLEEPPLGASLPAQISAAPPAVQPRRDRLPTIVYMPTRQEVEDLTAWLRRRGLPALLTTHYSLLTTHYSLLTTHYSTTSLLTTHCSLLTTDD